MNKHINERREASGTLSGLRAEYYYFNGYKQCFRAGLRICWTTSINGSLFSRLVYVSLCQCIHWP